MISRESYSSNRTIQERIDHACMFFKANQLDAAEYAFRTLLSECPLCPDVLNSLATVLDAQHRYHEAIAYYHKSLSLKPDFTVARFNYANSLKRVGDVAGCKGQLEQIVSTDPQFVQAWQNLAAVYLDEGRLLESARCLEKVVAVEPEQILAWADLGDLYYQIGEHDTEALSCMDQVLARRPDFAAAYNSKGLIFHEQGNFQRAVLSFRVALALEPDDPFYMNNLGLALHALKKTDDAIELFNRSICLQDSATTHFNRGMSLLAVGNYRQGWLDYECRFEKIDPVLLPSIDLPLWKGEPLRGKTIVVRLEQGYGDCIQCMRFVSRLAEYNARIIVECLDNQISPLFDRFPGVAKTVQRGEGVCGADFQVPIFSLPLRLGVELQSIPGTGGYLMPEQGLAAFWEKRIKASSGKEGYRVGIVWGGRKTRLNANRSLQLADLAPLFDLPDCCWYSLQKGEDVGQLEPFRAVVHDLSDSIFNFDDTAAIIAHLDLVVTIDTSVAHLCGALGKSAFVMLKFSPDWRWGVTGEKSVWYDSLSLVRQPQPGDWCAVVEVVREKLLSIIKKAKAIDLY